MTPTVTLPVLAVGCALIGLASRRWRTNAVPWGVVPLFAAAGLGYPFWFVLALAALVVAIETPGRPRALLQALPPVAVVTAIYTPEPVDLSQGLQEITLIVLGSMLAALLMYHLVPAGRRKQRSPWHESGAGLLLLGSSATLAAGLSLDLPLLAIVGLTGPAMLPALLVQAHQQTSREIRLQATLDSVRFSSPPLNKDPDAVLQTMAENLHGLLQPILGHDVTVLVLNPTLILKPAPAFAAPENAVDLPRIRERARYLFQSGKLDDIEMAENTTPGDVLHLDSGHPCQLLLPVRDASRAVALLSLLGRHEVLGTTSRRTIAEAVAKVVLGGLRRMEIVRRLQFLSERGEQQGRRLRHLLELNQLVSSSPDLRSLTQNLVRAVGLGFGCSWTGLLLDVGNGDGFRLAAWAGDVEEWEGSEVNQVVIRRDLLDSLLIRGSVVSRFRVLPIESWPIPLPQPLGVRNVLATPLASGDDVLGHMLVIPHPLQPMPDLEDLRALELVLDQVSPSIGSALQLQEVHRKTLLDPLTGVANRRSLDDLLQKAIAETAQKEQPLSFAMLDIDDFKNVNDRYGHRIGDVVLKELAAMISRNVRVQDFVARYGGEEFSVVMPVLSYQNAVEVLDRLRMSIAREPFASGELSRAIHLTVSIGVATFPYDADSPAPLVEQADGALYEAKRQGKDRVVGAWEVNPFQPFNQDEPLAP